MPRIILLVVVFCLLLTMPTNSYSQQCPQPITKNALLTVLKKGVHKDDLKVLIAEVRKCKVSFQLGDMEEQEFRDAAGDSLDEKRLNDLIAAIREHSSRRFFLDVTPRELVDAFKKNPLQAELAIAGYKGKWLRVEAVLTGILPQLLSNDLSIQVRDADGISLTLYFDRDRYIAQFASLRGGEHLSVSGIFDGVILGIPLLKNCELNKDPVPESKKAESAPQSEQLRHTEKETTSPLKEAPYGLQVTIQTNVTIEPILLNVVCSGPITGGDVQYSGYAGVWTGGGEVEATNHSVYVIRFRSPAFVPERPIVANLYSKNRIKVVDLKWRKM